MLSKLSGTYYVTEPEVCSCARIRVGMELTENRNWDPDCPAHGVDSAWWKSPEQVEKRRVLNERLRSLYAAAREARKRKNQ